MAETAESQKSTASSNTQQILTDDSFKYLAKAELPVVLGRVIESVAVYFTLSFQSRNIAGYSHRDAVDFFILYQIFAVYFPMAFQIVLQIRYSVAHVNDQQEELRTIVCDYALTATVFSVFLACAAYPLVLLFRGVFGFSERLAPSLYYFTFVQFPLSAFSTSFSAKYMVEGRRLLMLATKVVVFGVWQFLEAFVSQFSRVRGTSKGNLVSVVCCGLGHAVAVVWIWLWNNGFRALNAINQSRDRVGLGDVFGRAGGLGRARKVLVYLAESVLISLQYLSSALVLLLVLREVGGYANAGRLDLQLLNYFVYCDVFRISAWSHSQLTSLVYTVSYEKRRYRKALELIFKMYVLSALICALLFLVVFYGRIWVFFCATDEEFIRFMATPEYRISSFYAGATTLLSSIVETSQSFIIHNKAILPLAGIVTLKLVLGITARRQMVVYYGEDCDLMLLLAFSEGIGIAGHLVEVIFESVLMQIQVSSEKKRDSKHKK